MTEPEEEVGFCGNCGASILRSHPYPWCTKCGEPLAEELKALLPAVAKARQEAAQDAGPSEGLVDTPDDLAVDAEDAAQAATEPEGRRGIRSVIRRYKDGYGVASFLVGFGQTVKILGVAAAAAVALIMLLWGTKENSASLALGGIVIAVSIGGLFFVCGVIVSALGQLLLASLDAAVHSSPFMTNAERVRAMGLPENTLESSAGTR